MRRWQNRWPLMEGEGTGGGGAGGTKTFTQEEVDAAIAAANTALEASRDTILGEKKIAIADLKKFDGFDVEEFKTLKAGAAKAEREKAEGKGDWTKLEENLVTAHGLELQSEKDRTAKAMKSVDDSLVVAELTRAIAAAKGDVNLLLPHARKYVQTRETDTGYEAFVVDGKGTPAFSDGKGTPMTFDQLVETVLVVDFPRAFEGTGSSGGGASKSSTSGQRVAGTIAADDGGAFMDNLEGIANDTVQVR